MSGASDYGKGDRPRPVNRKLWDENWAKIKWEEPQEEDIIQELDKLIEIWKGKEKT